MLSEISTASFMGSLTKSVVARMRVGCLQTASIRFDNVTLEQATFMEEVATDISATSTFIEYCFSDCGAILLAPFWKSITGMQFPNKLAVHTATGASSAGAILHQDVFKLTSFVARLYFSRIPVSMKLHITYDLMVWDPRHTGREEVPLASPNSGECVCRLQTFVFALEL